MIVDGLTEPKGWTLPSTQNSALLSRSSSAGMLAGNRSWVVSTSLLIRTWTFLASSIRGRTTTRLILGSGRNPVLAPHQSSLRSKIFWSAVAETSFHGPVVTGQPFARSRLVNVF